MIEPVKIYALTMIDGTVSVMQIFEEETTIEKEIAKWHIDDQSKVISYREVTKDQLPTDRTFRAAWTDKLPTNTVDIDIEKAKKIKLDIFRELRKPKLEALDIDYMIAVENNDQFKLTTLKQKKQALRDITKVTLPNTVEELKTFLPEILK